MEPLSLPTGFRTWNPYIRWRYLCSLDQLIKQHTAVTKGPFIANAFAVARLCHVATNLNVVVVQSNLRLFTRRTQQQPLLLG